MKKIQKKQRLENKSKDGSCGEEKSEKIKMKEEDQSKLNHLKTS